MAKADNDGYGINFYGYRIKHSADKDSPYARIEHAIALAKQAVVHDAQKTILNPNPAFKGLPDPFSEESVSGLPLLKPLGTLISKTLGRDKPAKTVAKDAPKIDVSLGINEKAPHVFQFSNVEAWNLLPDNPFALFLTFLDEGLQPGTLKGHVETTLARFLNQSWVATDDWPDIQEKVIDYLSDLINGTFIDRNGTALQFSLSITDVTAPSTLVKNIGSESPQLAGELLYAVIECLGDIKFGIPASAKDDDTFSLLTCKRHGVIEQYFNSPDFPDAAQYSYIDTGGKQQPETDFAGAVIAYAAKSTEGAINSLIGGIMRAAGAFNNDVVSTIVATAVAVAAKKAMEYFTNLVLRQFFAAGIPAPYMEPIVDAIRSNLSLPPQPHKMPSSSARASLHNAGISRGCR